MPLKSLLSFIQDMQHVPDLAFNSTEEKHELLEEILAEVDSKSLKDEKARENAGLLAEGNMFHGDSGSLTQQETQDRRILVVARIWQALNRTDPRSGQLGKEYCSKILFSRLLQGKMRDAGRELERHGDGLACPNTEFHTFLI